eukprot:Partr_v1_DN26192_c0_g1_i2_m10513 putative membrane-associated ring finger (C3HC4) 6, E3 ubiquitin protein ligase
MNVCRICRAESTADRPLRSPCVCTGSIRYVHSDCLLEWVRHSRSSHCHICKHPYTIHNTFTPLSPVTVSRFLLKMSGVAVRYVGVVVIWALVLPVCTNMIFEAYGLGGQGFSAMLSSFSPAASSTASGAAVVDDDLVDAGPLVKTARLFLTAYAIGILEMAGAAVVLLCFMMIRESVLDYLDLRQMRALQQMPAVPPPVPPLAPVVVVPQHEVVVPAHPEAVEDPEFDAQVDEAFREMDRILHGVIDPVHPVVPDVVPAVPDVVPIAAVDNDVIVPPLVQEDLPVDPIDLDEFRIPEQNNNDNIDDEENDAADADGLLDSLGFNGNPIKAAFAVTGLLAALFVLIGLMLHIPRQMGEFIMGINYDGEEEEQRSFMEGTFLAIITGYAVMFVAFIAFYLLHGRFQNSYRQEFSVLFLVSKLVLVFSVELFIFPFVIGWAIKAPLWLVSLVQ